MRARDRVVCCLYGLAVLIAPSDARALTGALCQLPGSCTTSWSQQSVAHNIDTGSGNNLFLGTAGGCQAGADCYTNPQAGIPFNLYIEFADDSTTPWTTAQKQMWAALFTALGSTQWFSQVASMYAPTDSWGAFSSGASFTLSNCLPGTHCQDFTYTAGGTTVCQDVTFPEDQYGIYLKIPSQPNVAVGGLAGANASRSPNGHCVFAGQTNSAPTPLCWGGNLPTVTGTVSSFTVPSVGSTVTINLATGNFLAGTNVREYIETAGWYSIATGGGSSGVGTNLGTPLNAAPTTVITTGQNVEHLPAPLTPNGCVLDNQINLALSELFAAITNFHAQGWAQYALPGVTCPPCNSPSSCVNCSHEQCLAAATNGIPSNDFQLVSGTQTPTSLATTMFSTNYNFLLAGAWSNTQASPTLVNSVGPLGYCFGRRTYGDFWNVPCRQNSDCPSVSGVCNGTALGSHCAQPSCSDGVKNGFETDIDCGGWCGPCAVGSGCSTMWDCQSGLPFGKTLSYCVSGVCTDY